MIISMFIDETKLRLGPSPNCVLEPYVSSIYI